MLLHENKTVSTAMIYIKDKSSELFWHAGPKNLLSFKDALFLLNERGKAMQNAVPIGKGGMIAVLGSDIKTLESLINKLDKNGVCEIANDNSVGQIIVSGDIESINSFKKLVIVP